MLRNVRRRNDIDLVRIPFSKGIPGTMETRKVLRQAPSGLTKASFSINFVPSQAKTIVKASFYYSLYHSREVRPF